MVVALVGLALGAAPADALAHPLGNFSISHYSGLSVHTDGIELRYLIDMAEIPTFQEMQDNGIVADAAHPSLDAYLARTADELGAGLVLEVNGARLGLRSTSRTVLFTPGAGSLPTMKLGVVYRAALPDNPASGLNRLVYRDGNFPDRAGWKEVVAQTGPGVAFEGSSVPAQDRSRLLTDYPTDLLNSPPQIVEASLTFLRDTPLAAMTAARGGPSLARPTSREPTIRGSEPAAEAARAAEAPLGSGDALAAPTGGAPLTLESNRQATRRDRFTDLVGSSQAGPGLVFFAALVAATLGAFHALEPGHGKTVVAAYLVGSRGTARHAMLLGLIVTASHTAGVYLLGAVTLYASRYVMPERLYPWLGALSGLTIAGLGFRLFLKRYAGQHHGHAHGLAHEHSHAHDSVTHEHPRHPGAHEHSHHQQAARGHRHHGHSHHHHVPASGTVSLRELLALGVTGGIVPCPAALVVLLSAVALRRVGFGLFLIVAFSVGLAAVLIAIGLSMVYAHRLMARVADNGPLLTRWLPLTSSATITLLGVAIAAQALTNAGILTIRLG
jgi:ABC-type nickel/cobalt efflux system permease component RcnA